MERMSPMSLALSSWKTKAKTQQSLVDTQMASSAIR